MSLDQLLKRQETLVAEMTKSLKARGFDGTVLGRPLELRNARGATIKARINAIEDSKKTFLAQADAQIADLKAELASLEVTIKREREMLKPATDQISKQGGKTERMRATKKS